MRKTNVFNPAGEAVSRRRNPTDFDRRRGMYSRCVGPKAGGTPCRRLIFVVSRCKLADGVRTTAWRAF